MHKVHVHAQVQVCIYTMYMYMHRVHVHVQWVQSVAWKNLTQVSGRVVLLSECHVQHVCTKVDNLSFYGFVCVLGVVKSSASLMGRGNM